MKIIEESGREIRLTTPDKRIPYYLQQVEATSLKDLKFTQRKQVFLMSIKDFLEGTLCLEEMSSVANQMVLFPDITEPFEVHELDDAIYACAELAFYVRKIPEVESQTGNFIAFMTQVKEYYQKYSSL